MPTTRAQRLASAVHQRLGFSAPPANPAMLVACAAIEVVAMDWPDELAGLLVLRPGGAVIGLNRRHSAGRRHFTLWHEVGHYLLHLSGRSPVFGCARSLGGPRPGWEREADAFAVSVTMPERWLRRAAPEARSPRELARRFGVTNEAMQRRLRELGLAPGRSLVRTLDAQVYTQR